MESSKSQFVGASGTFYVMARLAYECVHASATFGNAPYVDIIASSKRGDKQISIQVKTADFARRSRGRGKNKKWAVLDWALSYKAASMNVENLFFAFVDLGGSWESDEKCEHWQPTVYIIPSVILSTEICKDWLDGWWRLQIDSALMEPWKENWGVIKTALGEPLEETILSVE